MTAKLSIIEEDNNKTQFFLNKDETDLTNSKRLEELGESNVCWIKCNKLGAKVVKLQFSITVEKLIEVGWRDKPLNIKSTYNSIVREVRFNVLSMFHITKTFKEAINGSCPLMQVPLPRQPTSLL